MDVVTRFAPSPTGFLHIGGVRTALFNFLYARRHGGKFLLRVEDTDRKRSTPEAIDTILEGLSWLGLMPDEQPIFQFSRRGRHTEVVTRLLDSGHAYHCYCTPEELKTMRENAKAQKRSIRYDGTWRERDPSEAPPNIQPVVRFKAPIIGETIIQDAVQGSVTVANHELDDLIMLRADGTPTYMLSVVVDDHDKEISHVIRGDDHLTNAFRQTQMFNALGWKPPIYAHLPLIHGPDGGKLSKRHGTLGINSYQEDGYLPEALINYLARLGWSHGDEEFFSVKQAVQWFALGDIHRSAARFDYDKLSNLNSKYISVSDNHRLLTLVRPIIEAKLHRSLTENLLKRLYEGMESLKSRARTLSELAELGIFYCLERPLKFSQQAQQLLTLDAFMHLKKIRDILFTIKVWDKGEIEENIKVYARDSNVKLNDVAQPLRAALTGNNVSPGIFEVISTLGRSEAVGRIDDAINSR